MKHEFYYLSKNGTTQIHAIEWIPEGKVTAVVQMCHGMSEHIDRYDAFAQFLAEHGIYAVGHDHLGHGKSVSSSELRGFFDEKNGNDFVIGDIHELRTRTQKKYAGVPYFMLGHSMGSFLLRQYLGSYSDNLAGAIIVGTGEQPSVILAAGKLLCKLLAVFKGWTYRSPLLYAMSIGAYEKEFGKAWLARNEENVKAYREDPLCGFVFTLNAYYHMFDGMAKMNTNEHAGKIPKKLPLLFAAGEKDPVGDYGKGVKIVFERYQKHGAEDAMLKLYSEDIHEILNEVDRDKVYQDIWEWIESKKK